ncbi:MAG: hypothetical protein ACK49N_05490 [Verrucomicrobiota bacterium]|jgi:hypothetical protein
MSLDKKERLAKKRNDEEEAKKVEAEKLNPSFPYKMEVFPYDFFGYEQLTAPTDGASTS